MPRKKTSSKHPHATPPPGHPEVRIDWGVAGEPLTTTTLARARATMREQTAAEAYLTAQGRPAQDGYLAFIPRGYRIIVPGDLAPACKQPNDTTPKGDFEMDA